MYQSVAGDRILDWTFSACCPYNPPWKVERKWMKTIKWLCSSSWNNMLICSALSFLTVFTDFFLSSTRVSSFLLHHTLSHGANALNISYTHIFCLLTATLSILFSKPLCPLPVPWPWSHTPRVIMMNCKETILVTFYPRTQSVLPSHIQIPSILRGTINLISDQHGVKKKEKKVASVAASSFMRMISFGRKSIQSPLGWYGDKVIILRAPLYYHGQSCPSLISVCTLHFKVDSSAWPPWLTWVYFCFWVHGQHGKCQQYRIWPIHMYFRLASRYQWQSFHYSTWTWSDTHFSSALKSAQVPDLLERTSWTVPSQEHPHGHQAFLPGYCPVPLVFRMFSNKLICVAISGSFGMASFCSLELPLLLREAWRNFESFFCQQSLVTRAVLVQPATTAKLSKSCG